MTYRVYFNKRGPMPWSVDSGPDSIEIHANKVIVSKCTTNTVFEPSAGDNVLTPTAWLEVFNAKIVPGPPGLILLTIDS